MLVNRIIPISLVDGPGSRTAIFLQGCNFNCISCHNPHTINVCNHCGICIPACPSSALTKKGGVVIYSSGKCSGCDRCMDACPRRSTPKAREMSVEEVFDIIKKSEPFIEGITFSGGECSLQWGEVVDLIKKVKQYTSLTTLIDTNGWIEGEALRMLTLHADGFMVDLKAWDDNIHRKITGFSNRRVFETIKTIAGAGKLHEIRCLIIPGITDNHDNIRNIGKFIASLDPYIPVKLLKFRPHGVRGDLAALEEPGEATMKRLRSTALEAGLKWVVVR